MIHLFHALGFLLALALLTMAVLELGAALRAHEDRRSAVVVGAVFCAMVFAAAGYSLLGSVARASGIGR